MIYPPLEELTQGGKYSRYVIVSVVAKCARKVTEEYVTQREYAEKLIAYSKLSCLHVLMKRICHILT